MMNAPHFLICVEKPKYNDSTRQWDESPGWLRFLDAVRDAKLTFSEAETPAENVWLLPLSEGLQRSIQLLALCDQHRISHKVFLLGEAPALCA